VRAAKCLVAAGAVLLSLTLKTSLAASDRALGEYLGDMPKSGFSANSQAKVAAMMIRGELANGRPFPARYSNTCWSLIETDDTVKVGGSYAAKDGKIAATETFVSKTGESAELRKQTQAENTGWYAGIVADIWT
jgi:sulfide dehydrogenase [flavocytochrome c] flavoprotein subunit